MNAAYLAPIIGLVVAALLAGGALMLIRRPAVRAPGPTPHVPTGRRVVVIGGGFGGLQAVNKLRHKDVDVTLIDRRNFHLFQPLVYQVATGALSPGEIATPLRASSSARRTCACCWARSPRSTSSAASSSRTHRWRTYRAPRCPTTS